MPQILKNIYCIKFLNEANQFFKKEKTEKGSTFSEIYKFYEIETNFIDFSKETVLIILYKGNINLIKELEYKIKIGNDLFTQFDNVCNDLKEKYYLYMIYYPDDKEIFNLYKICEEQDKKIHSLTELIGKLQSEINDIKDKNEKIKIEEIPINKHIKNSNTISIKEEINNYKDGKEKQKNEEESEKEEYEEEEEEEDDDDIDIQEKKIITKYKK